MKFKKMLVLLSAPFFLLGDLNAIDPSGEKVIDTTTFSVVKVIPIGTIGGGPDIAITSDGKFAYACNYSEGKVYVVEIATNSVVATIPLGASVTSITLISN